jgi:hypothetical protein
VLVMMMILTSRCSHPCFSSQQETHAK